MTPSSEKGQEAMGIVHAGCFLTNAGRTRLITITNANREILMRLEFKLPNAIGAAMVCVCLNLGISGMALARDNYVVSGEGATALGVSGGEANLSGLVENAELAKQLLLKGDVAQFREVASVLVTRLKAASPAGNALLIEQLSLLSRNYLSAREFESAIPFLEALQAEYFASAEMEKEGTNELIARAQYDLAKAFLETGQTHRAESELSHCIVRLESSPQSHPKLYSDALFEFGQIQMQLGKYAEALSAIEESVKWGGSPEDVDPKVAAERARLVDDLRTLAANQPRLHSNAAWYSPNLTALDADSQDANSLEQLGRFDEARPFRERALGSAQAMLGKNNPKTIPYMLGLALNMMQSGQFSSAREVLNEAMRTAEQPFDKAGLVSAGLQSVFAGVGVAEYFQGLFETEKQRRVFSNDEILSYASKGYEGLKNHYPVGNSVLQWAKFFLGVAQAINDDPDALKSLTEVALVDSGSPDSADIRLSAAMFVSLIYADQGKVELMALWGKKMANELLLVDTSMSSNKTTPVVSPETRRSFLSLLTELLIADGRFLDAQEILELSREHDLEMTVRSGKGAQRPALVTYTKREEKALALYREAAREVNKLIAERNRLMKSADNVSLKASAERIKALNSELIPQRIEAAIAHLNKMEKILTAKPKQKRANGFASHASRDSAIQRAVIRANRVRPDLSTLGVQYVLTKNRLTIVVTPPQKAQVSYQVPIDRAAIYRQIQEALLLLQSPESSFAARSVPLLQLHAILIEPIEGVLREHRAKSLFLSLPHELSSLPFSALLNADGRYLIEDYAIALFNEAAETASRSSTKRDTGYRVAAMGASDVGNNLPKLPAVPQELSAVISVPGISGDQFLDTAFTRKRLQAELTLGKPRSHNLLHIASHFVLKAGRPEESLLYFGDGSTLSLAELVDERLDFSAYNLVTYSACQTAVSAGRMNDGREMESLSVRTQRQGAKAVLATLWKVPDKSSPRTMRSFYLELGTSSVPPHAALQKLQRQLIAAGEHPYGWAAYVISTHELRL